MLLSDVEPPLSPLSKLTAGGIAGRGPNEVCSAAPASGSPGCAATSRSSISLPWLRPAARSSTSSLTGASAGCGARPRSDAERSCTAWLVTQARGFLEAGGRCCLTEWVVATRPKASTTIRASGARMPSLRFVAIM